MKGIKGLIKAILEEFYISIGYFSVKKRDQLNTANTSVIFHNNIQALHEGGLP